MYHGLCDSNKLLYKRCVLLIGRPPFRSPHFQPIFLKLKTKKETREGTLHAKFGWRWAMGKGSAKRANFSVLLVLFFFVLFASHRSLIDRRRLLKKINSTLVTDRQKTAKFQKTSNLWRRSSAVMKVIWTSTKVRTKLKGRRTFHCRLFGALRSTIFGWKPTSACQGCHSLDGDTLVSKVYSNKLRLNV